MIQDIEPHIFHNEYVKREPRPNDYVLIYDKRDIVVKDMETVDFPLVKEFNGELQYLFSLNDTAFFLGEGELPSGYIKKKISILRLCNPQELCFAGMTGFHLYNWYRRNRYCGACATPMNKGDKERVMICPNCGNMVFPTIAPAVIMGVTHGDSILMSRYAGREFKGRALLAGFCEIGESAEATVRREVMEEVGLKVKNIRYYKSQPWGFDSNMLFGFYCDVDGSDEIILDTDELSKAGWVKREDIKVDPDNLLSLTAEMMQTFALGKEPK